MNAARILSGESTDGARGLGSIGAGEAGGGSGRWVGVGRWMVGGCEVVGGGGGRGRSG